ncbi:helix-turn-helix domain-containing protein [Streptomyces sp. NPDC001262]|uniref:helix-turn-helix domain-containing protein n=1 Tax=Streptomyces sp. NPDC001262 TaxID=3364552 RepID=UPI0036C7B360
MLRQVQRYGGASQARIATAVGMTQARVNEIINGRREVSRLDVYERIADGLTMPDAARHLLGLAPAKQAHRDDAACEPGMHPEVVRVYPAQSAAAQDIRQQAQDMSELDILAVRGLGLFGFNDSLLRGLLSRPDCAPKKVRVFLLDPDAPAIATRAAEIGESPASLSSGVHLAEARLRELATCCRLELYRYRALPTWRIIRLDTTMFVSAFDAGWEGHESATYKVVATPQGPLYRGFLRMLNALAAEADRIV